MTSILQKKQPRRSSSTKTLTEYMMILTLMITATALRIQDFSPIRPHLLMHDPEYKPVAMIRDEKKLPMNGAFNHGPSAHFSSENETQDLIHWFMHQLKLLFYGANVNAAMFEEKRESFSKVLADIENFVFCLAPHDWQLKHQVNFVKYVFDHLADFVDTFGINPSSYDVPRNLAYRMAELGVALYQLHDSHGNLDLSQKGYINKLYYMWDLVTLWSGQFEGLGAMPEEVKKLFYQRKAMAEREIEALRAQI